MEKPGSHHLNHMVKVHITSTKPDQYHEPLDMMHWDEYNINLWYSC